MAASTIGVTLAGSSVGPDGGWLPARTEHVRASGDGLTVFLPRAGGVLLFVGPG